MSSDRRFTAAYLAVHSLVMTRSTSARDRGRRLRTTGFSALLYDLQTNAITTSFRKGAWAPSHSDSASTTPPLSSEASVVPTPTSAIY
ncbi:hypothetical protein EMVG_00314 [Emiliania huxleyi virus PS401]|nr:hypothetical protein EMVG_00314 [Emiliania huxleyi virus PS401]